MAFSRLKKIKKQADPLPLFTAPFINDGSDPSQYEPSRLVLGFTELFQKMAEHKSAIASPIAYSDFHVMGTVRTTFKDLVAPGIYSDGKNYFLVSNPRELLQEKAVEHSWIYTNEHMATKVHKNFSSKILPMCEEPNLVKCAFSGEIGVNDASMYTYGTMFKATWFKPSRYACDNCGTIKEMNAWNESVGSSEAEINLRASLNISYPHLIDAHTKCGTFVFSEYIDPKPITFSEMVVETANSICTIKYLPEFAGYVITVEESILLPGRSTSPALFNEMSRSLPDSVAGQYEIYRASSFPELLETISWNRFSLEVRRPIERFFIPKVDPFLFARPSEQQYAEHTKIGTNALKQVYCTYFLPECYEGVIKPITPIESLNNLGAWSNSKIRLDETLLPIFLTNTTGVIL